MPADLDGRIIKDSRKLLSGSAWLWLLDITISGVAGTIRLVNNTEDITYDSNVYTRCNFELGPWRYTETGELPTQELKVTNIDLVDYLLPYVEDNDGIVGATIVTTPVNSEHLDIDMSVKAKELLVLAGSPTEQWIIFVLGAPNPLIQWIQRNRYFADYCPFVSRFGFTECGYSGAETVCNGLLSQCKEYGNETRFGGEVGLRSKTVRFAW